MQTYTSKSLEGLDYQKKYNGVDYTDSLKPLVIFGMYRDEDFEIAQKHKEELTIVWCGSDAKELKQSWVRHLVNANHIAISDFIQDRLWSLGIESEFIPINSVIKSEWDNEPNGDSVYFYSSDNAPHVYGEEMIKDIERNTGIEIIRGTYGKYNRNELKNIYRKCFLNLRLTRFDGTPHTNVEMGLMGRKSVFNGNLPHSIKWSGVDDICESIIREYNLRHLPNKHISETYKNLNDGM